MRSLLIDSIDSHYITTSDADNILKGWNATNQSWAPSAPCQPSFTGQMKNAWPGIWLDSAAQRFGDQSAKFFAAYSAAGGQLDEIVLDTEIGLYTSWGVADNMDPTVPGVNVCVVARWTAVQDDPRFPPVLAELQKRGFVPKGDTKTDPHWLAKTMEGSAGRMETNHNRDIWNTLGREREVEFWEVALFKAAKAHFPHVRGSNWGYRKWTPSYCIPAPDK